MRTALKGNRYALPPAFSWDKTGKEQPGKGLYTEYVHKIPLATDRIFPWQRGRVAVPSLVYDRNVYPAPIRVEIFHVYAGGSGIGIPALDAPTVKVPGGKTIDMSKGFGQAHDFDDSFIPFC